jgi:CBS domain-containing protein
MSGAPITVRASTSVSELNELFEVHDVNAFPVVDNYGRLAGIVSKLDLLRLFRPGRDRAPSETRRGNRVEDIMSPRVITVDAEDSVATAVDRMLEHGLRSLPVVDKANGESTLVGMVSRSDLLCCLCLAASREPAGA